MRCILCRPGIFGLMEWPLPLWGKDEAAGSHPTQRSVLVVLAPIPVLVVLLGWGDFRMASLWIELSVGEVDDRGTSFDLALPDHMIECVWFG